MKDRKQELIERLKEESTTSKNRYTLLENKIEFGHEFAIVLSSAVEGIKRYYPSKKYEVVLDTVCFKEIINYLEKLTLTYQDILFIQKIPFEDFTLLDAFLLYHDYRPQLVLDYASRIEQQKVNKTIVDRIKEEIDKASSTYSLKALDELVLGSHLEEIQEYAKEKNIEIIYK